MNKRVNVLTLTEAYRCTDYLIFERLEHQASIDGEIIDNTYEHGFNLNDVVFYITNHKIRSGVINNINKEERLSFDTIHLVDVIEVRNSKDNNYDCCFVGDKILN